MSISFTCPQCGLQTEVDDRYAGQTGPCRQCGATVTVPGAPSQPFAAPPPRSSSATTIIVVLAASVVALVICGGVLAALLLPAVQAAREAARRNACANNLKQIGIALNNYSDMYGTFPPGYVADANGKPMHSWRVLILPFLQQQALYNRYNFDEPWDGPSNSQLAAQMPPIFRCPSDPAAATSAMTSYVGVSGPGTVFDGDKAASFQSMTDGTSNTMMVVEFAGGGVNWMEPRDLDASQLAGIVSPPDGLNISSHHPGGVQILLADGSVRFLSATVPTQLLQALTTIAGNEIAQGF